VESSFSQLSKNAIMVMVGKLLVQLRNTPLSSLGTLPAQFDDEAKETLASFAVSLSAFAVDSVKLAYEDLALYLDNLSIPARDSWAFHLCSAASDCKVANLDTQDEANLLAWLRASLDKSHIDLKNLSDSRRHRVQAGEYATRVNGLLAAKRMLFQSLSNVLFQNLWHCAQGEPLTTKQATAALSSVLNVDPSVLKSVMPLAEANSRSPSVSVRESAISLLGAHITKAPEVVPQFCAILLKGLKDESISVKKTSLKFLAQITADLNLNRTSVNVPTYCCYIMSKINDEDEAVQVCKAFFFLFFIIWTSNSKDTINRKRLRLTSSRSCFP